MPTNREELEQELLEQAQKAIKKMLDELPETRDITLSDLETSTTSWRAFSQLCRAAA